MERGPAESRPLITHAQTAESHSTAWPGGAPFALFLSHDIDQIYDRELFRLLGNVNHLRRIWLHREPGSTLPCVKRVARALLRPREPGKDVETILAIERGCGFRSTFFLLEDRTFNHLGGRYRYSDPATKRIAKSIEKSGCEIALHGAYHNYNDPEAYRAQVRSFREAFGWEPRGIRNHYLRHAGIETWKVQREAGFLYDATFGSNDQVGLRDGRAFPFFPFRASEAARYDFVVVPMTIMDVALFGALRLAKGEALALSQRVSEQVVASGGLLCLNWHNTYFDEEEYRSWQGVYENLVGWLAGQRPWNATGEEIADWWMSANGAREWQSADDR